MRLPLRGSRGLREAIALLLSLAIVCSPAFPTGAFSACAAQEQKAHKDLLSADTKISLAAAVAFDQGVLIKWKTSFELDNVGFNVYRLRATKRLRLNREIIGGSVFIVGHNVPLRAGYSYSFFDRNGTPDSTYSVEAVGLNGSVTKSGLIAPQWKVKMPVEFELIDSLAQEPLSAEQTGYPSQSSSLAIAEGQIENQWAIASQFGLKISVKKDGWYRVTHQQMTAAGFSPAVDIEDLQLFNNARELAILTNRSRGPFVSGDFIEFYGRGLDTATTDINTYYLLAATTPGKRIVTAGKRTRDQLRPEDNSTKVDSGLNPLPHLALHSKSWFWWFPTVPGNPAWVERTETVKRESAIVTDTLPTARWKDVLSIPQAGFVLPERDSLGAPKDVLHNGRLDAPLEERRYSPSLEPSYSPVPATVASNTRLVAQRSRKSGVRKGRKKPRSKRQYSHTAANSSAAIESNFDFIVEKKDRSVYFVSLLNGNTENFFGQVITSSPVTETLATPNPESTATSPVLLEIALQGASHVNHVITVQFNDVTVGTMSLSGLERKVQTYQLPISALTEGENSIRLIPAAGSGLTLVDYTRLSYAHSYRADNGSLRFTVGPTQPVRVDGFSSSAIRVIDYSDPFAVRLLNPLIELNDSAYTIQLSAETAQSALPRLLYAFPESEFDQSAILSLNQPSSLNLETNAADLLIISHGRLVPSLTPLINLRASQGLTVSCVNVEDVYDEFGYGAHGPQAIRDFLALVSTRWSRVPRYVILAGDASYDPRNYLGLGERDFVPTKLVDATFNETSSDDWFTDFNNDGIADIPVGRLPASTASQASVVVSKIVNFTPAGVPQSALLVADAQRTYYFNFEQANTQVQALLPASMSVERVDRRTETSDAQASANIINKLNSGQAVVNYSGHGNVNTWTDGSIFTSDMAMTLTNGNKLPLVVVMDCLNGYFHEPNPTFSGLAEAFLQAPGGGAVASFASSGLTIPDGQHEMGLQLYALLYGSQSIALGDAIKIAKASTKDMDVRRTWIFFGDPSMKIR